MTDNHEDCDRLIIKMAERIEKQNLENDQLKHDLLTARIERDTAVALREGRFR